MSEAAVIFGMQRCGSNFFLSACTRFDDLTVYGEMYHRDGVFPFRQNGLKDFAIKQRLAGVIRQRYHGEHSPFALAGEETQPYSPQADMRLNQALAAFAHGFPGKYFAALKDSAAASRVLLKIFPEHLSLQQMLAILHEHRPHVILMLRDPVDTYISFKKLVATEKPQDSDTSALKVAFDRNEYYEYKTRLMAYFKGIIDYCIDEKLRVTAVAYEKLHEDDGQDKVEKVRRIVEDVYKSPVLMRRDNDFIPLFTRQDRAGSAAAKVSNPEQLPHTRQRLVDERFQLAAMGF